MKPPRLGLTFACLSLQSQMRCQCILDCFHVKQTVKCSVICWNTNTILFSLKQKVSKVWLQKVTKYCSYFEDEKNNEFEDLISDSDYDATVDSLANAQWMTDTFEEEDFSKFFWIPRWWKTRNYHPERVSPQVRGNDRPAWRCNAITRVFQSFHRGVVAASYDGGNLIRGTKEDQTSFQQWVDTCYSERKESVHWAVCHHGHSSAAREESTADKRSALFRQLSLKPCEGTDLKWYGGNNNNKNASYLLLSKASHIFVNTYVHFQASPPTR